MNSPNENYSLHLEEQLTIDGTQYHVRCFLPTKGEGGLNRRLLRLFEQTAGNPLSQKPCSLVPCEKGD